MAHDTDPRRRAPAVDETPPLRTADLPSNPTLELGEQGVGWLTFDDPERRLNVLTVPVMRRLAELIVEVERLAAARQLRVLVVRSGKADSFIAGADVEAIAALADAPQAEALVRQGQEIYLSLERLPVPTIAAIHGVCLGGGTELSLACRYRVASDSPKTRIGLAKSGVDSMSMLSSPPAA